MTTVKDQVRELVDSLPDDATWDDVIYDMVVRRAIELGLADSEADRVVPVEELIKDFVLEE